MPLALLAFALLLAGCGKPDEPVTRTVAKSAESRPVVAATPTTPAMAATPALAAQAGAIGKPTFPTAPAGWTEQDPGAMRKGSWKIGAGGGNAELAVTAFPGDVGGRMANINRWRGQLGLEPATAELYDAIEIAKVGADQGEMIRLKSKDGARATLAVMARKGDVTWFLKLSGDSTAIDASAQAFTKFVTETHLP